MRRFQQLERIDIAVPCGLGSEPYFEFFAWSALELAHRPEILRFIVLPNHGADTAYFASLRDRFALRLAPALADHALTAGQVRRSRARTHGRVLNALFASLEADVAMIADCDVALVRRGWDEALYARLGGSCAIVGTGYPEGQASEMLRTKYRGFPTVVACMFDVAALKNAQVDFAPDGFTRLDEREAGLYGRRAGELMSRDVGHELPLRLRAIGYTGVTMPLVWPDDPEAVVLQDHEHLWRLRRLHLPQEFQLDGEPVLVHLGKSEARPFGRDPVALRWERDARRYIATRRAIGLEAGLRQ